jgi:SAM-dependent methyltransferase
MGYASHLRSMFPDLELEVSDILLLEPHQLAALTRRIEPQAIADAIATDPHVADHLISRYPPIACHLEKLPSGSAARGDAATQDFLWEIADWFVYVKAPEMYDAHPIHDWDFTAVTDRVDLAGSTVIDAGAGTGKISFEAAAEARLIYALEPCERLRRYIDDKAAALGIANVETLAGTLDAMPLPDDAADALLTCRAVGWNLGQELVEIARVVRPGGVAIHLCMPDPPGENQPLHDGLVANGYTPSPYLHGVGASLMYIRRF